MNLRWLSLLLLCLFCENTNGQESLPEKIVIYDFSRDNYGGMYDYRYALVLKKGKYDLIQEYLCEFGFRKEKKKTRSKTLGEVSVASIKQLVEEIVNSKDTLTINELGYDYKWFNENNDLALDIARKIWVSRWPDSPGWNTEQIDFIQKQLINPVNISDAVRRRFLYRGNVTMHNPERNPLRVEIIYSDSTMVIESGGNFRRLPWKTEDGEFLYNQEISTIIYNILPQNRGFNKRNLKGLSDKDILESIIDQIYKDDCESTVASLAFHSYKREIDELKGRYKLWSFKEEGSASYNWDGEKRLCMFVKDTNELRKIRFKLCLAREGNSLYSRDSIRLKSDYCLKLVNQIPFLLDYLDEDQKRSIEISFDNSNSLSEKMKKFQSGENTWANGICLNGKSESYLNRCVAFILRNEFGNGSNWLITPDLDVILIYYQHTSAYKYTDEDFGLSGPSIRYACQHFDLKGNLIE
ncbi:MAG: hypothetical protein GQ574_03535 [Crocinitomix sp.]|nr:hypothetical protein [Crocinitomix sp.]